MNKDQDKYSADGGKDKLRQAADKTADSDKPSPTEKEKSAKDGTVLGQINDDAKKQKK
nr:hypothetical protein [Halomonas sp. 1513]